MRIFPERARSFLAEYGLTVADALFGCAVCVFFFLLPLRTDATASIAAMTVLAAWCLKRHGLGKKLLSGGAKIPLLAFAAFVCIALVASALHPWTLAKFPRVLLWGCCVFSGVVFSLRFPRHGSGYFWALFAAIAVSFLGAVVLFGYDAPRIWHDGRLKLFAIHPSRLGLYCSACLLFLLYRTIVAARFERACALAGALFVFFILFSTNTRGNLLMLPLGFLCLAAALPRRYVKHVVLALLACACIGGSALWISNSPASARLVSAITDPFSDPTFATRRPIWDIGWELFTRSPAIGHGYQSFQKLHPQYVEEHKAEMDARYPVYEPRVKQAHNLVLGRLVETGVPGAVAFLVFYCGAAVAAWRGPRENRWLLAPLVFYLGMNMLDDGLFRMNDVFILFVAGTSLGFVARSAPGGEEHF